MTVNTKKKKENIRNAGMYIVSNFQYYVLYGHKPRLELRNCFVRSAHNVSSLCSSETSSRKWKIGNNKKDNTFHSTAFVGINNSSIKHLHIKVYMYFLLKSFERRRWGGIDYK